MITFFRKVGAPGKGCGIRPSPGGVVPASIFWLMVFVCSTGVQPESARGQKTGIPTRAVGRGWHNQHRHGSQAPAAGKSETEKNANSFVPPDSTLLDQNGKKIHFYTDLVKGTLVVINFIYTSCNTFCPAQGANFSRLQSELGDRLGKEVFLISISVDPETDTPQRLKSWAAKFGAKRGWTLVTGQRTELNGLVGRLTGDPLTKDFHGSAIFIGNDTNGKWIREYGLANPIDLMKRIDELALIVQRKVQAN